MAAATTAVRPLDPAPTREPVPDDLALAATLLTEAALAAATCVDTVATDDLIDRAARLAASCAEHPDDSSGFGPVVVDLARALAAARLGDNHLAVALHQHTACGDAWQRLPAEHRAAHLIDIARAHLDVGDHQSAGRALVTADRIAPAEVRLRPAARSALAAVLRAGPTPADLAASPPPSA
ncbi:hypothetical protein GA0074692_2194 [Micromonospora pallida]|uniref:Uncharacterized protein n=2 Tax=Micromonospora pallida TaxID=145854 RepID=A0A1C6SB15_9ACTN|nr:hypothetical protein GA0074692_2194 [Micromonospora pallida]